MRFEGELLTHKMFLRVVEQIYASTSILDVLDILQKTDTLQLLKLPGALLGLRLAFEYFRKVKVVLTSNKIFIARYLIFC